MKEIFKIQAFIHM